MNQNEVQAAFAAYDREFRINNSKLGAVLAIILMPAGASLDYFVYPDRLWDFLKLRLLCSSLVAVVWLLFLVPFGKKHYRFLGMTWYMLPAFFIAWMIYAANDPYSAYYAGLNIVLLGVGLILPWTYKENLLAVTLVILMYLSACYFQTVHLKPGVLFNNLYFLVLTGIIVVTGSIAHGHLRFREFALRHELDQSRALLAESNEKLKELDQIKNRFFANISHELRTPLTLLLSPLETMIHTPNLQFDGATRNLMSIMHGNGMRLLKLINDLLDLVRLESGRMEIRREPVDMTAFVRGLIGAANQMAETKGLKLETAVQSDMGPLLLDRDKVEKTVLNLVFNALKFTPRGGTVTLRVQRAGDEMVMEVEDTGVGISEKNLPHVFDRFWQADNSSKRKYQGVGIGLSLVKELTEIQGGSVSVTSTEGKGTTFFVSLPFMKAEGQPAPIKTEEKATQPAPVPETIATKPSGEAPPAQSEEWLTNLYRRAELFPVMTPSNEPVRAVDAARNGDKRPTLLVADDEPDMLRFLKSQLGSHYRVIEASDGQQAADNATRHLPDAILLDMNMPEKDGLQVCRELRQQISTQNIPIIVLTARADEETKLSALSAGANDFLCKPFSTSELHVRVKNLVESRHYQLKLSTQNQKLEETIEQLKETETMLVQTEKMASLGRMSAGIIHEINNPLNYATTGLYTLKNKAKFVPGEQQAEYTEILHEVEEGISRVKNIVLDLKSFTHPDTEQQDAIEVSTVVNLALRFLSNEWKDKIRIEQKLPEHLAIRGNRNKLVQVFVNMLQNSLDAIRCKKYEGEKPAISIEGRVENKKTVIIVRDNGEGMDRETVAKVFDPFFTTKDVGEGMGLGLTICYRIVQEYEGRITVNSQKGKYSEFKLEFPNPTAKLETESATN